MKVKKVMTFKSGKFAFSHNYSQAEIEPLEIEFRLLYDTLKELPILPKQAQEFELELTRRSIFSTAAIEGNPLREREVAEIIDNDPKQTLDEIKKREIYNLKKSYDQLTNITPESEFILSESFIKSIHKTVTDQLNYDSCIPGSYRSHVVKVGDKQHGGVDTPPKCLKDIQNLMVEYIQWFHSYSIHDLPPVIRSAIAHYYLVLIHPFADGNGRTARLIEAAILRASGIKYLPTMLSNYYYKEIDEYFIAISLSEKSRENDITPFVKFVLKGAIDSLNEVKSRITSYIRKSVLQNYFSELLCNKIITTRQLEFLSLLIEFPENKAVTINGVQRELPFRTLYATVSDRTARRDLMKLHELNLLKTTETGFKLDRQILNAL
ncbi:MAG: Fic family protein [Deltaproteobacteria bacterium]|nr:Fic family protein [Deltaproteobacteria bacterium]